MSTTEDVTPTKEISLNSFGPNNVIAFNENFGREIMILKAMSELICNADLESFSNSDELSWGLKQMFDLFCEKQESRVKDLCNEALNSPEYILQRAQWVRDNETTVGGGLHNTTVLESLKNLDLVIDTFGGRAYRQAAELKDSLSAIAAARKLEIPT